MYVAEYIVNAKRTGKLRDFSFLEKWKAADGVIYARAMAEPGVQARLAGEGRA